MREAQTGTARLSDLDVEDFGRICEFAYRGEYQVPSPYRCSGSADSGDTDYTVDTNNAKEQEKESSDAMGNAQDLYHHFLTKSYLKSSTPHAAITALFSPQDAWDPQDDYTPVLLGHAHLYTFGDRYLIHALKNLSLKKIHKTLAGYSCSLEAQEAVMELARYAYDTNHTSDRVLGKINPLRELVVEFVVSKMADFKFFASHRELLEEEGEYATDVLDILDKWLL